MSLAESSLYSKISQREGVNGLVRAPAGGNPICQTPRLEEKVRLSQAGTSDCAGPWPAGNFTLNPVPAAEGLAGTLPAFAPSQAGAGVNFFDPPSEPCWWGTQETLASARARAPHQHSLSQRLHCLCMNLKELCLKKIIRWKNCCRHAFLFLFNRIFSRLKRMDSQGPPTVAKSRPGGGAR